MHRALERGALGSSGVGLPPSLHRDDSVPSLPYGGSPPIIWEPRRQVWGRRHPDLGLLYVSPSFQVRLGAFSKPEHEAPHPPTWPSRGQTPCSEFLTRVHSVWTLTKKEGKQPPLEGTG